ncbi:hypothetical protein LJB89_04665, partial [Tyzzerella sp. OttesenSCG-928-J15]|nr:hypothetical protein [Tyzzerella sp. OttesenSCG-928-J15]
MRKHKNRFSRQILSFVLALVTLLTSIAFTPTEAQAFMPTADLMPLHDLMPLSRLSTRSGGITYYENQNLTIENAAGRGLLISIGGSSDTANFAPHQVIWNHPDRNQVFQAYCVNPAYSGYGDVSAYDITIMEFADTVQFSQGGSNGSGHLAGDNARGTSTNYKQALWGAVTR